MSSKNDNKFEKSNYNSLQAFLTKFRFLWLFVLPPGRRIIVPLPVLRPRIDTSGLNAPVIHVNSDTFSFFSQIAKKTFAS